MVSRLLVRVDKGERPHSFISEDGTQIYDWQTFVGSPVFHSYMDDPVLISHCQFFEDEAGYQKFIQDREAKLLKALGDRAEMFDLITY